MTDTQPIIDAALAAADPSPLGNDGRFFTVVVPGDGASVKVIDLDVEADKLRDTPRRKTGNYQVHDAASFVAYVAKHGDPDTEVWADAVNAKITGVLNAHATTHVEGARFEDHRLVYGVQMTEAWKRWTAADGHLGTQSEFAELIEDRAIDIVEPLAADMLEIAQHFHATSGVTFESSKRLTTGERQLAFHETVDAKAGRTQQMEIPETFVLGLRPFEGADAYKVTARLRYRITDGVLRIGFKLERPEDVLREAFIGVVEQVQTGVTDLDLLNSPVFLGSR